MMLRLKCIYDESKVRNTLRQSGKKLAKVNRKTFAGPACINSFNSTILNISVDQVVLVKTIDIKTGYTVNPTN